MHPLDADAINSKFKRRSHTQKIDTFPRLSRALYYYIHCAFQLTPFFYRASDTPAKATTQANYTTHTHSEYHSTAFPHRLTRNEKNPLSNPQKVSKMSPMYKISPRAKGSHSWPSSTIAADVESPLLEGRTKLQTMAWLNSPEGRQFFEQISSAQRATWLQKLELKTPIIDTPTAQSKHSDTAKRWSRETSPKKSHTTVHTSLSSPPKKAGVLLKPLNVSPVNETSTTQKHSSVFNHSSGTSRFVRQARLLSRGSSLFPRPVVESTDSNTIASILRASERRLCATETPVNA